MQLTPILLTLSCVLPVFANPVLQLSTGDTASTNFLTNLLGSFQGPNAVNVTHFLSTFDMPACMRRCMPPMDNLMKFFDVQKNPAATKKLCEGLQNSTKCATAAGCSHVFMDVVTNTFKFMCIDNIDKVHQHMECLKDESDDLQRECEAECSVQTDLINKMRSKKLQNDIIDMEGLCNSTTCLVHCLKDRMEGKCAIGEHNVLDTILSSVMRGNGKGFEQVMGWIVPDGCKDQNMKLKIPKRIPLDTSKPLNVGKPPSPVAVSPTARAPQVPNNAMKITTEEKSDTDNSTEPVETALLIDGEIRTLQCRLMDWERNAVATPDFESLARLMTAQLLPFSFPDNKNNETLESASDSKENAQDRGAPIDNWQSEPADQVVPTKTAVSKSILFVVSVLVFAIY